MKEPKNCKCKCHFPEEYKHIPHKGKHHWGEGFTIKYDGKVEVVQICLNEPRCGVQKREFINEA